MDQTTLVDEQLTDGRKLLERYAADGNRIAAAFWVESAEEGLWFLYLVTDKYDLDGPSVTYRTIYESLKKVTTSSLTSSEIKAIGLQNPIYLDIKTLLDRNPNNSIIRLGNRTLGMMSVNQIIIYPRHVYNFTQANAMTTDEISRALFQLMNRGPGIWKPSLITLKDGTQFQGIPFSIDLGTQKEMTIRFIDNSEFSPRVVKLSEISSIIEISS